MTARTVATGGIRGASFAPSGPDRLVYGDQARSEEGEDSVRNLYTVNPDGSDRTQLTTDGDSLQALWTARGIVYARETRRGVGSLPAYQLWLLRDGDSTELTHLTPRMVSSRRSDSAAASRRGSPAATRPPGTADPARVGKRTRASCLDRKRHRHWVVRVRSQGLAAAHCSRVSRQRHSTPTSPGASGSSGS